MYKLVVLMVVVAGLLGSCAPLTEAEASEQGLLHQEADPVVIRPDDPYIVLLPRGGATPLPVTFAPEEVCSCEWQTWETSSGLMCLGIVCSPVCLPEYAACRERQACIAPPGVSF